MKKRFINLYMDWAKRLAQLSYARRLQVGAVIVKDDSVISLGYNGTPTGWDNTCEDRVYPSPEDFEQHLDEFDQQFPLTDENGRYKLKTKPEVLHAEMNALMKLAKSNRSGEGAAIFVTHAPCMECAKGIYSAGISEVYYANDYRTTDGVYFLRKCGIKVAKHEEE
jgi:dCMP deaminase